MKFLIADDHPLYREAAATRVARIFAGSEVVEVSTMDELCTAARQAVPAFDLFLVDFHMPGMSAASVEGLVQEFPLTPVAIISGSAQPSEIRSAIGAGARGYIAKTSTGEQLAHAINLILSGVTSIPAEILFESHNETVPAMPDTLAQLTQREREVLSGVARGLSNKEIGRELHLAEVTVKLHLRSLFRKTGARSRADAAVMAVKAGVA